MPWSGNTFTRTNGTYTGSTVWTSDAGAGVKIVASRHDAHDQDLANGINACLHKGGQNTPTANISWGSFKITDLANGTLATDAATYGQTITALTFDSSTNILTATRSAGNLTVDLTALAGGGSGGSGTVTSVALSPGTTGLTVTGSPITTSGTFTLGGTLAVAHGGTGGATAADARTNLGLGTLATLNAVNNSYWSGAQLSIANGGTGATTAANARANLGLGSLATLSAVDNSNWSGAALAVSNGGTGATTAAAARTNLGLGSLSTLNTVNDSNWSGTALSVANGGTGATTAAGARTNLGLGSIATKNQTVSTAGPSGTPADGDIWLQYV